MRTSAGHRRFRWIGGPTFELRLGPLTVLTDPMFSAGPEAFGMRGHPSTGEERAPIARIGGVPAVDVGALDVVVVSHLHSDHFDREATRLLPKHVPVVAPAEQAPRLEAWGFESVWGMEWWESLELGAGLDGLEITALPARHSADEAANEMLGVVNGYAIRHRTTEGDVLVYWTGDTVWFDGLTDIRRRLGDVQLVVPHIGAVGRDGPWGRMTMDAAEARRLMELFESARVIPIHHHTFSHYVEPVEALVSLVAATPLEARLHVLREGEVADPFPRGPRARSRPGNHST